MKFKHLFVSTLLLGGAVVSCSDDIDVANQGPGQILENETTTFVRVSIVGEGVGSIGRATPNEPGYEDGTADENAVNSLLLTFFDAGRNYVGRSVVDVKNATVSDGNGNTVEKMITVIAQVDLPENINYPKYVMAYVNPTSASGDLGTEKLEDVMGYVRGRNTVSANGFRTMNNSVFFSNTTGNSRYATEVDFKTNFFESYADAAAAVNATVEITVERMEAKVRTSIDDINVEPFRPDNSLDAADDYSMTFVPEAWFVNATEKRSFLIKNYRTTRQNYTANIPSSDIDFGYNLAALNRAFVNSGQPAGFTVNDFDNQRSYWAISPTYFYSDVDNTDGIYPDVSYDVKYGENINTAGKDYTLQYVSYTDAVNAYNRAEDTNYVKFKNGVKTHEYVLENTQSINTLRGNDAKASMTSVVVCGHYVITKNGVTVFDGSTPTGGTPATNTAFYVRHEANGTKVIMLSDKEAKDFFLERSGSTFFVRSRNADGSLITTVQKDAEGNDVTVYSYEAVRAAHLDPASENNEHHVDYGISYDDFSLVYPTKAVTNGIVQSEQWRTLGVTLTNGKASDELYVFDSATNTYKPLNDLIANTEEWADELERMYSSFGVLEKFQAGKAYFNVPLKHIWGNLASASNTFEADKVRLGDYGVVRNHIYDLTINSIKGLGTGIGDIRQPIVPPTQNEQYYISTRLNILKWRVVGQSVDL